MPATKAAAAAFHYQSYHNYFHMLYNTIQPPRHDRVQGPNIHTYNHSASSSIISLLPIIMEPNRILISVSVNNNMKRPRI